MAPRRTPIRSPCAAAALAVLGACSQPAPLAWLKLPPEVDRVVESPHFTMHTDFAAGPAEQQRRVLEGMCVWLEQNWFPDVADRRPLRVLLFADGRLMQRWNESHELSPAAGRYIPSADLLVVDLQTGIGTALHELVHYYLRCACAHERTRFVEEGIASFFEKFLGHIDDDGALHLTVGYFHPWRWLQLHAKHEDLKVQDLWAQDGDVDYEAARAFMQFLHREGHLRALVDALRTTTGDGRKELEALTGRDLAQLDRQWHEWVAANPPTYGDDTMLVDRSLILQPADWQQWLKDNAERLTFDAQQHLWRVRR